MDEKPEVQVVSDGWITTDRAAELTGYRDAHIRRLAIGGRVDGRKVGRDWLISEASLLAYQAGVKRGRPREEAKASETD